MKDTEKEHVASSCEAPDRSAGVPPAVAGASRPRFGDVEIHDRGYLPHWEKESATYFITFREAGSLPKSVLDRIESERRSLVRTAKQLERDLSPDERRKVQRLSTKVIEQYLDSAMGACHLRDPRVAEVVAGAVQHFDSKRYRLSAWCVMPNHVHVVLRLFPGQTLPEVVHSWKSFSSKKVNQLLHSISTFWQKEYYDHLIRDQAELERAIQYVAENPVKAGLQNWQWVWVWGRDAPTACPEPIEGTAGGTPALREPA
jgi:REP element-mobilizing transposase RayT